MGRFVSGYQIKDSLRQKCRPRLCRACSGRFSAITPIAALSGPSACILEPPPGIFQHIQVDFCGFRVILVGKYSWENTLETRKFPTSQHAFLTLYTSFHHPDYLKLRLYIAKNRCTKSYCDTWYSGCERCIYPRNSGLIGI